jgi:hypothetical protein
MGYQIRIVPEVQAWLAALRTADRTVASLVDEAIEALRVAGESLGPPLIVPLDQPSQDNPPPQHNPPLHNPPQGRPEPHRHESAAGWDTWRARAEQQVDHVEDYLGNLVAGLANGAAAVLWPLVPPDQHADGRPDLDLAYQRQLEMLTKVRRGVADVATFRKRVELQIDQLDRHVSDLAERAAAARAAGQGDVAADFSARQSAGARRLAELRERSADLGQEEERLTLASQRLQAKIDAFRIRKEARKATWTATEAAAEAARAEAMIDDMIAEADRPAPGAGGLDPGSASPSPQTENPLELSELRPGAPQLIVARILFTVEEPGTAVLLGAGTERDWLRAWHAEATALSRARYRRDKTG